MRGSRTLEDARMYRSVVNVNFVSSGSAMTTGTTMTAAHVIAKARKNALTATHATNKVTASLLERIALSAARFVLAALVLTVFRFSFVRRTAYLTILMNTPASGPSVPIPSNPHAILVSLLAYAGF